MISSRALIHGATKAFAASPRATPVRMLHAARPTARALACTFRGGVSLGSGCRAGIQASAGGRRFVCVAADISGSNPVESSGLLEAGYIYLDVRSEQEYSAGHVAGSTNIPWMFMTPGGMSPNPDFLTQVAEAFPDKDTQFLMGCKSGKRSYMAACAMAEVGYSDMVNLEGGFDGWVASGLPSTQ